MGLRVAKLLVADDLQRAVQVRVRQFKSWKTLTFSLDLGLC